MAGALGDLVISLSADLARFSSDLGRANYIAEQHARQIQTAFTTMKTVIGAVAGSAVLVYVKSLVDAAEETDRLAKRVGYTVEQFSAFSIAAKLGKVSSEEFAGAAARFNKSLVEGSEAGSKIGKVFKALGVDITQGPAEALKQFAARASAIDDVAVKTAVFKEVMGKTGDTLIPVFAKLAETTEQAKRMGAVLSTETAEAAAKLNDNLELLGRTGQTVLITTLTPLVSVFATIIENVNKATERGEKYTQMLRELGKVSVSVIGDILDTLSRLPSWMVSAPNRALLQAGARVSEVGFNVIDQAGVGPRTSGGRIGTANILGTAGAGRGLVVPPAPPSSDALRRILSQTGAGGADVFKDFKQRLEQEIARTGELLTLEKVIGELKEDRYKKLKPEQITELKNLANIADLKKLDADRLKQFAADEQAIQQDRLLGLAEEKQKREELARLMTQWESDHISRQMDAGGEYDSPLNVNKELGEYLQQNNEWAKELGLTFSSAFEAAITGGNDLRDVMRGLLQDLIKLAAREYITKPVFEAFTNIAKGAGAGGAGGLLGAAGGWLKNLNIGGGAQPDYGSLSGGDYGQFFAGGGHPRPNSWAIVGERGPEPVYFGAGGGTVLPNSAMGGTHFHVDMRGASAEAVADLRKLVMQVHGSVEPRVAAYLQDAGRRGR